MSKKTILAVAIAALAFGQLAKAQTNVQVFYDFGSDRKQVTTTIEGFYNDNWGNTFFFVDHDFNHKSNEGTKAITGTYMEVARCLNFWQNVPVLNGFSLQVEYNGGAYNGYYINNAFLAGFDYFIHSKDFKNTLNLKVLGKYIKDVHQKVPMQFTTVWGLQDIFGVKGLRFSGFADVWWENVTIFISEPQIWYNVGRHFGCDNLNVGGEVELTYNFAGANKFFARPCLGAKWVF
ncbi:MAG: DUF5020 family protein [Bacteroidales bacterium]|nr:DUF5020 family protein [Bacteroidales bacterium]